MTDINQLLKKYFGYDSFRPGQEEIIRHILSGKDALVLMPTGGGKSVCYQIPALALNGTTIVISPLLSLMKDQVDTLRENGILACALNSMQSDEENRQVRQLCIDGKVKLLYISPEKLLAEMDWLLRQMQIALFAIDEAHCISQWGHDFRSEYTRLSQIKSSYPNTPIVALTATADKLTREDIISQLTLCDPGVFVSSFDRPNLSLRVVKGMNKKQKLQAIVDFIDRHPRQSGIIYCMSRKNTEDVARDLREFGIETGVYHAGLSNEERDFNQNQFLNDSVQVMSATIAFGMGIDKSNVRWVIHYNLPKSMESYYQEIGRSGRDGMKADTLLFYSLGDLIMLSKFANESGQRELNLEKLNRMQQYAESDICRRRVLLSYFGEEMAADCGNCDVCKNPPERFDATIIVQKALSAIARTNQQVGMNMLIDILRGSHRAEIAERGYDQIKTFGAGAATSFRDWQGYMLQMLQLGFIEIAYNDGNTLKITSLGWKVLKGETQAILAMLKPEDFEKKKKRTTKSKSLSSATRVLSDDEQLFESLRQLRMQFATTEDVPAYAIFTDKSIQEMVDEKPTSLIAFSNIGGVSEVKLRKYGEDFVELIRKEIGKKREKGDTYLLTLECLRKGMSIEEISEIRKLQSTTVYSHIAHLVQIDLFNDWQEYVDREDVRKVKYLFDERGGSTELKPIFESLDGTVSYGKIRLALAVIAKERV